jgi:hypothetical protein
MLQQILGYRLLWELLLIQDYRQLLMFRYRLRHHSERRNQNLIPQTS